MKPKRAKRAKINPLPGAPVPFATPLNLWRLMASPTICRRLDETKVPGPGFRRDAIRMLRKGNVMITQRFADEKENRTMFCESRHQWQKVVENLSAP